jgi:hypothetical protein
MYVLVQILAYYDTGVRERMSVENPWGRLR